MKRDIDLERKILLAIEMKYQAGDGLNFGGNLGEGYDDATIGEHCKLLEQQGLIEKTEIINARKESYSFRVSNLTAYGYDYLELIRDDKTWKKIKKKAKSNNIPPTIDLLTKIAGTFTGRVLKELTE